MQEVTEEGFIVASVGRSGGDRASKLRVGWCEQRQWLWGVGTAPRGVVPGCGQSGQERRSWQGESSTQEGTGCANFELFGLHVKDVLSEDLSAISGNWLVLERTISEARDARASRIQGRCTCTYIVHAPIRAIAC